MAFTAEELRRLGLLPEEEEKKQEQSRFRPAPKPEVAPSFSADDLLKLGIPVDAPVGQQASPSAPTPMVNPNGFDLEAQQAQMEAAKLEDQKRALVQRQTEVGPEQMFTRGALYGERPEGLGFGTMAGALIGDAVDAVTPGDQEPNRFQVERQKVLEANKKYLQDAEEIFESIGAPMESGLGWMLGDKTADVAIPDEESETGYRMETVRLPDPRGGAFGDILKQATLTVGQEFGDLTEGNITQDGSYGKSTPDMQLTPMSDFAAGVLSFMAPGLMVDKVVRRGAKAIDASVDAVRKIPAAARKSMYGASLASTASATEAIISSGDDQPLIVNPDKIQDLLKVSPERASDVAMFTDGLIVNGAFEGLFKILSIGGSAVANKVRGSRALVDAPFRRAFGERETVVQTLKFLDPQIDSFGEANLKRNMETFSTILGNNSKLDITFGKVNGEVPVATVNAVMRGAEDYIRISRLPAKRGMTPEQWEQYVNSEATMMVNRLIGLTGTEAGAGQAVAQRQAEISEGVRDVFRRGADAELPVGATDTRSAMGTATDSLVDVRRGDLQAADDLSLGATTQIDEATQQLSTVASDNSTIKGLLDGSTPPTEFFRDGPYTERMKTLMGTELFTAYKKAFDDVDAAYAAIPNDPLPPEGILAFQSKLDEVVENANQIDSSGNTARNILGRVYSAFQPKEATDSAGKAVIETTEELVERLGDVGFQDMYKLKQQLSRVVDSQSPGPVRDRLIALRRHITDGTDGQIAILRNSGAGAVADMSLAADAKFKETMARFSNSEPMTQFSELAGTVRSVGGTYDDVAGSAARGEPDLIAKGVGSILPQITNDRTGAYFENFALAMDSVMSRGELDEVMSGRVTSEALYNLGVALETNDKQSAALIIDAVRPYARDLERFNPGLLSTLERAAGQVRDEASALTSTIDEAQVILKSADEARKRAEENILRKFVNPEADSVEAISNPRGVLLNMLSGNNAGNEYKAIIGQIDRIADPAERDFAMKALKATTIENITEKLFTSSTGAMVGPMDASRGVSMSNIQKMLESNGNNILDVIDTVFADDQALAQGYRIVLRNLATDELPKSVKFRLYGSDTASNLAIRDGVSTAILLSAGYMNPTAATARRLSAELVEQAERDLARVQKETLVNFLAYPEEAKALVDTVIKSREPSIIATAVNEFTSAVGRGARAEIRITEEDEESPVVEGSESLWDSMQNWWNRPK